MFVLMPPSAFPPFDIGCSDQLNSDFALYSFSISYGGAAAALLTPHSKIIKILYPSSVPFRIKKQKTK